MFEAFADAFLPLAPSGATPQAWGHPALLSVAGYEELARQFAGQSCDQGIYRLVDAVTGPNINSLLAEAFPDFQMRATAFGYDWLGRFFAVDRERTHDGQPLVLILEPGTGEALEIPLSLQGFHDELDALREPALADSFFRQWCDANPTAVPLAISACVGYKIPLFLGGKDVLDNLEVADLEVYWTLGSQLRHGTRTLTPGASVGGVSVDG